MTLLVCHRDDGLVTLLAFLGLNARWLKADPTELERLVGGVAAGKVSKAEVAVFVRRHMRRGPPSR